MSSNTEIAVEILNRLDYAPLIEKGIEEYLNENKIRGKKRVKKKEELTQAINRKLENAIEFAMS